MGVLSRGLSNSASRVAYGTWLFGKGVERLLRSSLVGEDILLTSLPPLFEIPVALHPHRQESGVSDWTRTFMLAGIAGAMPSMMEGSPSSPLHDDYREGGAEIEVKVQSTRV